MSFDELPTEIKTIVFSHFTTCDLQSVIAPISAQWKILALQPILWKHIEFHSTKYSIEKAIERLNCCFLTQSIKFCGYLPNILTFPKPLTVNNHVRKLKFTFCRFTMCELVQLVDSFPNVHTFHLVIHCGVAIINGSTTYLHTLNLDTISKLTDWKLLKSIKFINCLDFEDNRRDDMLLLIANKCELLEKIRVDQFCSITERSFRPLIELRGPQLRVVELGCELIDRDTFRLWQKCLNLTKLNVHDIPLLSDDDFVGLAKLPRLTKLEMDDCYLFDSEYHNPYKNVCFQQLEEFDFSCGMPLTRDLITSSFPRLKRVNKLTVEQYLKRYPVLPDNACY